MKNPKGLTVAIFSKYGRKIEERLERKILIPKSLGLGCCGIEIQNAMSATYDWQRLGIAAVVEEPSHADVMLVSGWINPQFSDHIKSVYAQMAGPKSVIAIGACALSGAPYSLGTPRAGAKAVTAASIIPVDIYVPGCPPRPEAILEALHMLRLKRNPLKDQDKIIYAALRGPSGH
jgi:NADH-quinone oxidoreductase subunit B